MNRGLKIGGGQRSRSMALAKWIAASGDENGFQKIKKSKLFENLNDAYIISMPMFATWK